MHEDQDRTKQSEVDRLLETLTAAFGGLEVVAEDEIVQCECWECEETRVHFRGRHWFDLMPEDLEYHAHCLSSFTPVSFRFFLPAFIRAALLDANTAAVLIDSIILSIVNPGEDPDWRKRETQVMSAAQRLGIPQVVLDEIASHRGVESPRVNSARWAVLSREQRQCVLEYFSFLMEFSGEWFPDGELGRARQALEAERNSGERSHDLLG